VKSLAPLIDAFDARFHPGSGAASAASSSCGSELLWRFATVSRRRCEPLELASANARAAPAGVITQ
jgi:hypothetical protein